MDQVIEFDLSGLPFIETAHKGQSDCVKKICKTCRWKDADKAIEHDDWPCWDCDTTTNSNWEKR